MSLLIERIDESNYSEFEDMVYWRQNGVQRTPTSSSPSPRETEELKNPNLFLFAAREEGVFVGWISLVYIPKLGPWKGRGHVYVDELWVEPGHRRKGLAVALMAKADELCAALDATGTRLYVNVNNPGAQSLYEKCGFTPNGDATFMEKRL